MNISRVFRTETPIETLKKNGIILPDITERGRIYSCNIWRCEVCDKNNAYQIPVVFGSSAERMGKLINISTESHFFCSVKCEAAWIVDKTCLPLTFKKRLWNQTGEKILYYLGTSSRNLKKWWQRNVTVSAPETKLLFHGHNDLVEILKNGSKKTIFNFYFRYLDITVLSPKLAKEFPKGLLMISLSEEEPSLDDPYSIGARFLAPWPSDILFYSDAPRKYMLIDPHPKLKLKRKIKLVGSEMPGVIDTVLLADLPKNKSGIKINMPFDKKITVYIGIKKYVGVVDNKFVEANEQYDEKYLKKDRNGKFYLPFRLEFGWYPDISLKESFEKQFEDFLGAARDFAESHAKRERDELLANGNFSQETLIDIGLFRKDWRQWKEKNTVQK